MKVRRTNIRMARAVQTVRKGLREPQSEGARIPAPRIHQIYVEKIMQSLMISPDRLLQPARKLGHYCVFSFENHLVASLYTG